MREELLGHLLGALEDSEQESLAARLERAPALRRELARLRRQVEPLQAARCDDTPPPGLAKQTCRLVFAQVRPKPAESRRRPMTPAATSPGWFSRIGWVDVVVAIGIFAAASLAIVPAVQSSRFHGQVTACQDNLRDLGVALTHYSDRHNDYFPRIPTQGPAAFAGSYAPTLIREQYLNEARRVVCPASPLARAADFHPPSFEEIRSATADELGRLRDRMGGSYGYGLGHLVDGVYHDTKNLRRATFALMADSPGVDLPGHQSINHGGSGQNVLFEDGGVKYVTRSWLAGADDDFFSNDEGLIEAGIHWNDAVIAPSPTPPVRDVSFQ